MAFVRGVLPFCDAAMASAGGTATLPYAIDAMPPAQVISKTLIHLMERPPGRTSRHIERLLRRPRSYAASMAWRLVRV